VGGKMHALVYKDLMERAKLPDLIKETFVVYLNQLLNGETGFIREENTSPPNTEKLVNYNDLNSSGNENLAKLVFIKLNGGLGTSMGLQKAKSLLKVKDNLTFLDVIAKQMIELREKTKIRIPLIFMNSFSTNKDTIEFLQKYPVLFEVPLSFTQNKYPRIRQDDFMPYLHPTDENQNWNPPGHGDIYPAMAISGVLDKLLEAGIEYAFVSNSDNLGAVVDTKILNYIVDNDIPFLMEVCERSPIDNKGGHLAQDSRGRLLLREVAQCPECELNTFQDINYYRYFNSNNLWINLRCLKEELESDRFILPMIVNPKTVDGTKVYQIETAMGTAISKFEKSKALIVPRSRFVPVKKTCDLLTIWSDAYTLSDDFIISLSDDCQQIPVVELDDAYYKTIDQLDEHFPFGAPSLLNCTKLSVTGDIEFGSNVVCEGEVSLSAKGKVLIENRKLKGTIEI